MKIVKRREKIDVFHNNGHQIGTFEYDDIWGMWCLRIMSAGLYANDLKTLYKYLRRLG